MDQAALVEAVKRADVLVPTLTDRIDTAVLSQAGENPASHRQLLERRRPHRRRHRARARGITVTNTPGVLTEDTADFTMALIILALPRRVTEGAQVLTAIRMTGRAGRPHGCLAGASGASASASTAWAASARRWRAAPRRSAFQIHYHNRRRLPGAIEDALEATYWDSLDQMLARMDIVSVNCPHTPGHLPLLSARRLKLLKREAYVVNTGAAARSSTRMRSPACWRPMSWRRGPRRVRAGAGDEPEARASRPSGQGGSDAHMGSATLEGRIDMGEKVIVNIRTFMDGTVHRTASCPPCSDPDIPKGPPFGGLFMCGEVGDPGARAGERIVFVPAVAQRLEAHGPGVHHQHLPPAPRRSRQWRGWLPAPPWSRRCPRAPPARPLPRRALPCRAAAVRETGSDRLGWVCRPAPVSRALMVVSVGIEGAERRRTSFFFARTQASETR